MANTQIPAWMQTGTAIPPKEDFSDRVHRYWLPRSTPDKKIVGEITFLDDVSVNREFEIELPDGKKEKYKVPQPIRLHEHNIFLNGHWRNWYTCLAPFGFPCPICAIQDRAGLVAYFTVIDHKEWTDKKDRVHKDELKLFAVKVNSVAFALIVEEIEERGGIRGCRYKVRRLGDKSPGVGDTFQFVRKEDPATWKPEHEPLNYLKVAGPRTVKALEQIVGANANAPAPEDGVPNEANNDADKVQY